MKKEMLINVLQPEECRIAIVEDGQLEELYVERTSLESYTGNIYLGKIVNLEPAIQAAFVDFSVGRNGFLHVSDVEPQYYRDREATEEPEPAPRARSRDRDRDQPRAEEPRRPRTRGPAQDEPVEPARGSSRDRERERERERDLEEFDDAYAGRGRASGRTREPEIEPEPEPARRRDRDRDREPTPARAVPPAEDRYARDRGRTRDRDREEPIREPEEDRQSRTRVREREERSGDEPSRAREPQRPSTPPSRPPSRPQFGSGLIGDEEPETEPAPPSRREPERPARRAFGRGLGWDPDDDGPDRPDRSEKPRRTRRFGEGLTDDSSAPTAAENAEPESVRDFPTPELLADPESFLPRNRTRRPDREFEDEDRNPSPSEVREVREPEPEPETETETEPTSAPTARKRGRGRGRAARQAIEPAPEADLDSGPEASPPEPERPAASAIQFEAIRAEAVEPPRPRSRSRASSASASREVEPESRRDREPKPRRDRELEARRDPEPEPEAEPEPAELEDLPSSRHRGRDAIRARGGDRPAGRPRPAASEPDRPSEPEPRSAPDRPARAPKSRTWADPGPAEETDPFAEPKRRAPARASERQPSPEPEPEPQSSGSRERTGRGRSRGSSPTEPEPRRPHARAGEPGYVPRRERGSEVPPPIDEPDPEPSPRDRDRDRDRTSPPPRARSRPAAVEADPDIDEEDASTSEPEAGRRRPRRRRRGRRPEDDLAPRGAASESGDPDDIEEDFVDERPARRPRAAAARSSHDDPDDLGFDGPEAHEDEDYVAPLVDEPIEPELEEEIRREVEEIYELEREMGLRGTTEARPRRGDPEKTRGRGPKPPIQEVFRRGDDVLVQVIKESIGNKGPTLSTYISIPGRYLVLMPGLNRVGVSRKIADESQRRRLREIMQALDPPKGLGFIVRTAGLDRTKRELAKDLAYLLRLWKVILKRIKKSRSPAPIYQESDMIIRTIRDIFTSEVDTIWIDEPHAFERAQEFLRVVMPKYVNRLKLYEDRVPLFHKYGLEEEIVKIQRRRVDLPGGGSIVIDPTEALVAIDVNSGNFRVQDDAEKTAYEMNLRAAKEIARQLRLRDLGGVIVNDFIDMRDEKQRRGVERTLREAVRRDRARTKILRMSQFGLVEMTRQRIRPSLKRSVYEDCARCGGAGVVKTVESMAIDVVRLLALAANRGEIKRVQITVAADVATYLNNKKRSEIIRIEDEAGLTVQVRHEDDVPAEHLQIECHDSANREVRLLPPPPAPRRPR